MDVVVGCDLSRGDIVRSILLFNLLLPSTIYPTDYDLPRTLIHIFHRTFILLLSLPRDRTFNAISMGVYDRADHQETLDTAARASGTMIYATGTYGFYGYAYVNLGENYQFVYT